MSNGINPVKEGTLVIDCTSMEPFLVDLPVGALVGKHGTQEGFAEAMGEILSNQDDYGVHIGIVPRDIQTIVEANANIAQIDAVLPAARKLVEMLEETRGLLDNQRHRQIAEIAALIDARHRVRSNPELLAKYEKTRAYRSATGVRAATTRRRNIAATEQDLGSETQESTHDSAVAAASESDQ